MENVFTRAFKPFGAALRQLWCFVLRLQINFGKIIARKPMYAQSHMLFTCFLFIWFGLEWLNKPKGTLYKGVVNEDFYVPIVLFLALDKERDVIMGLYVPFRSLFMVFAICSCFSPANSNLKLCCRVGASMLAILMFCYRLMIIRMMMKRKTVEFTPFILCFSMFLSASFWFIYSILQMDLFAAIPNGFASFLGAWQLILYAKYHLTVQQAICVTCYALLCVIFSFLYMVTCTPDH